jgi:hypothetical protein
MAAVLIVTDGAARDVRTIREFFLGPVQEATCGTALLGRQLRHPECTRPGNSTLFILGEVMIMLHRAQAGQDEHSAA